ncbi:hypothetical protein SK128_015310 [Halocaridina rubra]|uniref:Methyltransferase FkbM domain-containing protein n=1 Tax=Halocaridina rubra TaxID=373956 RepID=A0AAN9A1A4_HALRR
MKALEGLNKELGVSHEAHIGNGQRSSRSENEEGDATQASYEEITYRILGPLSSEDKRLIDHVKNFYLFPPSTEPYNLSVATDPTYTRGTNMGTSSYIRFHLQAIFAEEEPGFFVEAGALDGQFLSNTLWLEQTKGWTGLLVEPDKISFETMQMRHRKAWTSNTCLSNKAYPKQTVHISWHARDKIDMPWMHRANAHELGVTSQVQNWNFSSLSDKSYSLVQCLPLSTLLHALEVSTVDFLSLDVQGSEKDILRNFDWD